MGDRANIIIRTRENGPRIYLYTHWQGYNVPAIVHKSLEFGKSRWDDPSYLARIVFSSLTLGELSDIGFGLDTQLGDNEYPIFEIDIPARIVRVYAFDHENWDADWLNVLFERTFAEFVAMPAISWDTIKAAKEPRKDSMPTIYGNSYDIEPSDADPGL